MTKRAILWCGQVRTPDYPTDLRGRPREGSDLRLPDDDFRIQINCLELAFRAACALGVACDDIYMCLLQEDLRPQASSTDRHDATVEGLRRLVGTIERSSVAGDALLFIAVNHGGPDGVLATADPPRDPFEEESAAPRQLTPEVLAECLDPLQGAQVLVIATCYAGAFLRLGGDARRTVVAACADNEAYRVSRDDSSCSEFLNELFGAWCGVTHPDTVEDRRLPLGTAFERARQRLADVNPLKNGPPHFAGTTVWPD
jgi:hypothetical protein